MRLSRAWSHPARSVALVSLLVALSTGTAHALDKQGAAHGGPGAAADAGGFAVSGAVMLGVSLINKSYAARPDNTGLALMRYAGHADVDLLGRRLSIPIDVNMFSDKELEGLDKLTPSELDVIVGVTSTWDLGPGATGSASGSRTTGPSITTARPRPTATCGPGTSSRSLRPARASPHASPASTSAGGRRWDGSPTTSRTSRGRTTPAWPCSATPSTPSCRASIARLAFAVDTTFFTDKEAANVVRPSELDLTLEVIGRRGRYELHLAFEQDMPVDNDTLVQRFLYFLAACGF